MTTDKLAKLQRDLAQLKARMQRIDHETFSAKREIDELEGQIRELGKEQSDG